MPSQKIWDGILFLCSLLKEKLLEKKYPDKVEPADKCATDGNDEADDQSENSTLFEECGPSYDDLSNPVNAGDEKQNDLNQTALFVKPSHSKSP